MRLKRPKPVRENDFMQQGKLPRKLRHALLWIWKSQRGVTVVEVMIAAFLLVLTFAGLATVYSRGWSQIALEEDRRQATNVLQARLDGIRRDLSYDDLAALNNSSISFIVDGNTYTVLHTVQTAVPEPQASTVTLTVSWSASTQGGAITRSSSATTIYARTST